MRRHSKLNHFIHNAFLPCNGGRVILSLFVADAVALIPRSATNLRSTPGALIPWGPDAHKGGK